MDDNRAIDKVALARSDLHTLPLESALPRIHGAVEVLGGYPYIRT